MKSLKVALLTLVITASGCAEAADEKIVADAKSNDATQANATQANSSQNKGTLAAQIEAQLSKVFGSRAVVSDVTPFANGSILEVTMADGGMLHVLPDLEHFIYQNTLYQITNEGLKNISDTRMNANRAQAMASIKDSDTVFYPAKGTEKARINVFTDIDCGYCQKLHQEVPKLTAMGIAVRYLAYPRSGIKDEGGQDFTESYRKLNYVWCQKDREKAMTDMKTQQQMISMMYGQARSKTGSEQIASIERMQAVQNDMNKKVDSDQCDSPVANQFLLGSTLGVSGTPALITEEGELIPGYLPAAELAKRLGVM